MPDDLLHMDQAQHNEELAMRLLTESPPQFLDWSVVAAFYAGLHYFEAALFRKTGQHGEATKDSPHKNRDRLMQAHFPQCRKPYRKLFNNSIIARYKCTRSYFTVPEVNRLINALARIKEICSPPRSASSGQVVPSA